VLVDDMNFFDSTNWELIDLDDRSEFTGGQWVVEGPAIVIGRDAELTSINTFTIDQDVAYEVILDFEISEFTDVSPDSPGFPFFRLAIINPGSMTGAFIIGGVEWSDSSSTIILNVHSSGGAEEFVDTGLTSLNTKIRMRNNLDDSVTVWFWYNGQWEWDGNTAGFTGSTNLANPTFVEFTRNTQVDESYFKVAVNQFKIQYGSITFL